MFITLEIYSGAQFGVRFHKFYSEAIKNKIKHQGAKFLMEERIWVIGLPKYDSLLQELKQICLINQIHIEEIPPFIMNLTLHKTPCTGSETQMAIYNYTNDPFVDTRIQDLPKCIYENLKEHQKMAILRGLKRYGRMIINDSIGLGKKLVAIALSIIYKPEWPLLITCPFSLRYAWQEEFVKWIPNLDNSKIQVFGNSLQEDFKPGAIIFITSYLLLSNDQMLQKFKNKHFKIMIIDQASFLKQRDSEWSKNLVPYAMDMKRVLLLTGTSLYNNPFEIYNLLKIVRPDYMPDFIKFCCRYCDPVKRKNGVEFTGRSFHQEIELLFKKRFAICRTREDQVTASMPTVQRQKVEVTGSLPIVQQIQNLIYGDFYAFEKDHPEISIFEELLLSKNSSYKFDSEEQSKLDSQFQTIYQKTALSKLKHIIEFTDTLLDNGISFIVVGYQSILLDAIQAAMNKRKVRTLNFSKFFHKNGESNTNQEMALGQLQDLPDLFDNEGQRFSDHLFTGVLNYQDFIQGYPRVAKLDLYKQFSQHLAQHFEAIVFAELHWDRATIKRIEALITPAVKTNISSIQQSFNDQAHQPRIRQFFYVKSRHTADDYLAKLLYKQDHSLWEAVEHVEVARVKIQGQSVSEHQIHTRIEDKLMARVSQEDTQGNQVALINTQSYEFCHPPTQSFYDAETEQVIMSQKPLERKFQINRSLRINIKSNPEEESIEDDSPNNKERKCGSPTQTQASDLEEEGSQTLVESDSVLYGDHGTQSLNIESQLTKNNIDSSSATQKTCQTDKSQSNISQQSVDTCKSLSASQFKRNNESAPSSVRSSQLSSSTSQSQQRTLFDFKKVGFGIFKKTSSKLNDKQEQMLDLPQPQLLESGILGKRLSLNQNVDMLAGITKSSKTNKIYKRPKQK